MRRRTVVMTLLISAMVVALAWVFASNNPDGLDWVSRGLGFATTSEHASSVLAPFGSYEVPFPGHSFLSTFVVGIIGIAAVFILVMLAGRFIGGLRKKFS